jgi:hypothetical protein
METLSRCIFTIIVLSQFKCSQVGEEYKRGRIHLLNCTSKLTLQEIDLMFETLLLLLHTSKKPEKQLRTSTSKLLAMYDRSSESVLLDD